MIHINSYCWEHPTMTHPPPAPSQGSLASSGSPGGVMYFLVKCLCHQTIKLPGNQTFTPDYPLVN